jgi:hypothetical protein
VCFRNMFSCLSKTICDVPYMSDVLNELIRRVLQLLLRTFKIFVKFSQAIELLI